MALIRPSRSLLALYPASYRWTAVLVINKATTAQNTCEAYFSYVHTLWHVPCSLEIVIRFCGTDDMGASYPTY